MCGITAIISPFEDDHARLREMTELLAHRGPDSYGLFRHEDVSLGHRRLAILDLSPAGAQPMHSEDNRTHLICNGELYNYLDLNPILRDRGHSIRSGSDSETLLHLYEEYGEECLNKVNGMFAFAIWDEHQQALVAAVDRFGKKPLYYAALHDRLVLASEMKSLLVFPWIGRKIDPLAVDRYLTFRYVPAPLTIIASIRKLEPATMLTWKQGKFTVKRYWEVRPNRRSIYTKQDIDDFQELFFDATHIRMQSDVPLGLYLSGGVDSSAVAGAMHSLQSGKRISYTLSIDYLHDELERAKRIANYLEYEFNPVTVQNEDFSLLKRIAWHLDEPFGDLLCIPSYLLAQKAKTQLTVTLTGDGGDEILTGYFHQKIMTLRRRFRAFFELPGASAFLSGIAKATSCSLLNRFFDYPDTIRPRERLKLVQTLAKSNHFGSFYEGITSCFSPDDKQALYTPEFAKTIPGPPIHQILNEELALDNGFSFLGILSLMDLKYWLPFSLVFRLDKLNMAHGVETRSPLLDYRLVEMAINLSDQAKLNRQRNKEILRAIIERLYPPGLREKGKQAFYMPLTSTYEKTFIAIAKRLLTPERLERRGLFRSEYVTRLLSERASGSMLAGRQLVALVMFEYWVDAFSNHV